MVVGARSDPSELHALYGTVSDGGGSVGVAWGAYAGTLPMDVAPVPISSDHLLRSLPVAIVFTDREGRIVQATDLVGHTLGWTFDALEGRAIEELFAPRVRDALHATLDRWSHGGASPLEGRVIRLPVRHGAGHEVELGVRPHLVESGFVVAFLDMASSGDGLRAGLLDIVSAPAVHEAELIAAAAMVGEAFDWDVATVWAVDDQSSTLRSAAIWERSADPERSYRSATRRQPLPRGEGLPGLAWERDAVAPVDDVDIDNDPRFGAAFGSERRPRSGAMIPVRSGRRIVGILELLAYRQVDATLWLASEAEVVGTGVGQLVERFRERVQVHEVEGRLALALDAGELGVWTLDVRSGAAEWSARMAELHGVDVLSGGAETLFGGVVADDRAAVGHVLERARSMDETQTVAYRVRDAERGTSWISTRVTRVRANGGPPVLSAVSSDVTEQKRAEISLQRRRAAVEGLQWVSQAIIAGRQLTDTAIAVANAATGVLGADIGIVLYPEPGEVGSELAWAVSGLPGEVELPPPPRHVDVNSVANTATGVEVVRELSRNPPVRRFIESLELPIHPGLLRSALLVPVGGDRGRPLGLMLFGHADRGYFTEDDARLAASIGSSTGVAIENARRHEEQRLAAVAFQRQLLPAPELNVPDLELCVRYHPGRDGLDVGGDWYDVIDLGDGRVGLAVGDVCGHGLRAAAHMGQFRYSFRALLQSSSTPEEAFSVLNRMALQELATTVTIAYVEIEAATGACRTWCCGHLPPVISSQHGQEVRWVDDTNARGPMLGFLDDVRVSPIEATLAPGELLLLYTDGLVERRGEPIDRGMERLAAAFEGRSPALDEICDELHTLLAVAGPDADDTVLLGVRRAVDAGGA